MSEPKWTPGPWAVSGVRTKLGGEPVLTVYSEAPGPMQDKTHALVLYGDGSAAQHVQAHADARLIAAAPELYDELENARAIIAGEAPQYGEAITRIDASLAKARGGP